MTTPSPAAAAHFVEQYSTSKLFAGWTFMLPKPTVVKCYFAPNSWPKAAGLVFSFTARTVAIGYGYGVVRVDLDVFWDTLKECLGLPDCGVEVLYGLLKHRAK